jgi:hypothetical protein
MLLRGICTLALASAAAGGALAQTMSADQRKAAEGHGEAFVRALNADPQGDAAAVAGFYAQQTIQRLSVQRLSGHLASLRQRLGRLEYHHSEVAEFPRGSQTMRVLHAYARSSGATGAGRSGPSG